MPEEGLALWNSEDEFYYDEPLPCPTAGKSHYKLRSMVGLIPLFAVKHWNRTCCAVCPILPSGFNGFLQHRPTWPTSSSRWQEPGAGETATAFVAARAPHEMPVGAWVLDESEFLSDYGVRALSKIHEKEPYRLDCGGTSMKSAIGRQNRKGGLFGGNSNWRRSSLAAMNFLIIESLQKFHHYYGDDFKIECRRAPGNSSPSRKLPMSFHAGW